MPAQNLTTCGTKIEAEYENDRNVANSDLFEAMIKEALSVPKVICAHHLVYVLEEACEGSRFTRAQEIPSADALIFDHAIARKIWGKGFKQVLRKLACEPVEQRDKLLAQLYYGRKNRS